MASLIKAGSKSKRKRDTLDEDAVPGPSKTADEPPKKRNKQRVLLLSSRGVTSRMRHFMSDLEALLPHTKKGKFLLATLCVSAENELIRI
jgi:ribosome biogenesis protein BRX1